MDEVKKGFMDKTDFDFELENVSEGTKVFPTVKALKENMKCVDECGIVEVEIKLVRVVEEGKISK